MVFLEEITLKNFKSFKDEHRVDRLAPFTAVVGPNGSGKSNFMDAISFVLGVDANSLRVSKMERLICRSVDSPSPKETVVKIVVAGNDGIKVQFERSVRGSGCKHRINNIAITQKLYLEGLQNIHINPRVKDFIVLQDSVESFLNQSPKERAAMFEEISGSGSFASEYKRLFAAQLQLKQELDYNRKLKNIIEKEIKVTRDSRENAEQYKSLEKKHRVAKLKLTLFKLRCLERTAEAAKADAEISSKEIEALSSRKSEIDKTLANTLASSKVANQEIDVIERKLREMELQGMEFSSERKKLEAVVEYALMRVNNCRCALSEAVRADEARRKTIEEIEKMLSELGEKRDEYSRLFSRTLGSDVNFRSAEIKKYERLKKKFFETCANENGKLLSLERSYKSLEDEFDVAITRKTEARDALERQIALRVTTRNRGDNWERIRNEVQNELKQQRILRSKLIAKLADAKMQEESLKSQIEEIGKVNFDEHEARTIKRKIEIIKNLKQDFPGVFDRLGNLCKPIHGRYELAVNKVLAPHINSIVVDTLDTAVKCAEFLRERTLGVETFLPLDSLNVNPLKKHLRNLQSPPNVKLIYDVINFSPVEVGEAVLYVVGNTLVSESDEDAAGLAFDPRNKRYNCVSRKHGIYYRKSGLFSGGSFDAAAETLTRCNSDERAQLHLRKEELMSALREIRRELLAERELLDFNVKINSLEERVESLNDGWIKARRELLAEEARIVELEDKLDDLQAQTDEALKAMQAAAVEIEALRSAIQSEENRIFAEFCASIGVADIRQYESGHEEYQKTIQHFDNLIDRAKKQLAFETHRDTASKVKLGKKNLERAETKLAAAREQSEKHISDPKYAESVNEILKLEATYEGFLGDAERAEKQIKLLRSEYREVNKKIKVEAKKLDGFESVIQKSKERRRAILREAKINGLKVPMLNDPRPRDENSASNSDTSFDSSFEDSPESCDEEARKVEVDYSKLPKAWLELEANEAAKKCKELAASVAELAAAMQTIEKPNLKTSQHLDLLIDKKREVANTIAATINKLKKMNVEFEKVKTERCERFLEFFEHVQSRVDTIYKKLTRSKSAQTYLLPENPEEPYLGEIYYDCVAPGKRFLSAKDLSGSEKALASLSLLFAIQSSDAPPFQILDEIDSALDKRNVNRVVKFIKGSKETQQTIVISHKAEVSAAADLVIGIASKMTANSADSKIFTLNLKSYRNGNNRN